jgi:hypothetical protein
MCSHTAEPDPQLLSLLEDAPPSVNAIKVNNLDEGCLKNIVKARMKLLKAIQHIEKAISLLESEMALISRMIYRQRNQFRNDHGFKSVQTTKKSVEKCLQNYPRSSTKTLLNLLPQVCYNSVHLPDVSLTQYSALHIWLFKHSLNRVVHCCHLVTTQALSRFQLGHIWYVGALRLAIASRVWSLCIDMKKHVDEVLSALHTLSINIPVGTGLYSPEILNKIFITDQSEPLSEEEITFMSEIATKVENESFDMGVKIERPELSIKKENSKTSNTSYDDVKIEKINKEANEVIDLEMEDYKNHVKSNNIKVEKPKDILPVKRKKNEVNVDISFIKNLHTFGELKCFIDEESKHRKISRKESRTRKLGQEDWKKLKANLISSFKPNLPNKSIKLSRKLIRQALLGEN